jgi:hypothetical protein
MASGYLDVVKPDLKDNASAPVSVILDASELPIERPKKTKQPTIAVRSMTTL